MGIIWCYSKSSRRCLAIGTVHKAEVSAYSFCDVFSRFFVFFPTPNSSKIELEVIFVGRILILEVLF